MGLSYHEPSLIYLPPLSLRQVNLSRPHPLERGGADATGLAFPSEFRYLNLSPHPSREGRGSLPGYSMRLRAKRVAMGKVVVVGWVEDEQNSTVMGLM